MLRTRPLGPEIAHLFGLYKQSKYVAEHEVLRAGAEGLPVVLVQPTLPLGPGDRAPTPTGKTVLDFLNGRMPGWLDTALNVVDVDDVATGHLLAAERGAQGRSYVLGGENLELRQILDVLAAATGLPRPVHQGAAPGCPCRRRTPRGSWRVVCSAGSRASRSRARVWPRRG